jgi:hypothetical protein
MRGGGWLRRPPSNRNRASGENLSDLGVSEISWLLERSFLNLDKPSDFL